MIRHLPHFFDKQHGFRSLPVIAAKPFRDRWQHLDVEVEALAHTVSFFAGCAVDFIYPEQAEAMIKLIKDRSVKVIFPEEQSCCGLPALMAAEEETAGSLARQNYKAFESSRSDIILTLCASCASHLKHYYPKIARQVGVPEKDMAAFVDKVMDFSSFMINVLGVSPDAFKTSDKKVAYHSPCHLCRGMGVTEEPRKLIETAGLNYVPCADEDVCCGFGGSYSVDFPEISAEILKQKLAGVSESGADVLVSDCPGCVLQLRGGMDKQGHGIEVKHISEVVADQLKKEDPK